MVVQRGMEQTDDRDRRYSLLILYDSSVWLGSAMQGLSDRRGLWFCGSAGREDRADLRSEIWGLR